MTTISRNPYLSIPIRTASSDVTLYVGSYNSAIGAYFVAGQNMTSPAHVAIADPVGNGPVIMVTKDQYESISETASIIADKTMMDAIRQSENDIANGNTITNDALRAKLGL